MTLRKILKSVGAAILYAAIYPLLQIVVTNVTAVAVSVYQSFVYASEIGLFSGAAIDDKGYTDMLNAVTERVTNILLENVMLIALISAVLAFFVYFLIFRIRKKKFFKEVGVNKTEIINYPIAFFLGIALNFFTVSFISLIPIPQSLMESYVEATESATIGSLTPLAIIVTAVVAPIIEEIVYRGLFYTRLKRCMPMLGAMILSSFIFGLMHGTALIWVIYAAVLGFVLSWVFEKSGSLLASVLVHMGFNLVGALSSLIPAEVLTVEIVMAAFIVSLVICLAFIFTLQHRSKNKIEVAMSHQPTLE